MKLPAAVNPVANGISELRVKQKKHETRRGQKNIKGSKYLEKMAEDSSKRIVEFQYHTNIKKYKRRRAGEDDKASIDDPPAKKTKSCEDTDLPQPKKTPKTEN